MSFVVTAWHSSKLICGRGWPVSAVPVLTGSAGGCWGTVPPPVMEVLGAGQRDGWVGGSRGPCVPLNVVLEQRWAQLSLCVGADRWVPLRMGHVLQSLLYLQVSETCCYQGAHG